MRKKLNLTVLIFIAMIFIVGCSKANEGVNKAKETVEKYIYAINDKEQEEMSKYVDGKTISIFSDLDLNEIKLKSIKHDPKFNSEDTPKEKYLAFEIKYDIEYLNGESATEKKWISLEKVNDHWIIRSVAKA